MQRFGCKRSLRCFSRSAVAEPDNETTTASSGFLKLTTVQGLAKPGCIEVGADQIDLPLTRATTPWDSSIQVVRFPAFSTNTHSTRSSSTRDLLPGKDEAAGVVL